MASRRGGGDNRGGGSGSYRDPKAVDVREDNDSASSGAEDGKRNKNGAGDSSKSFRIPKYPKETTEERQLRWKKNEEERRRLYPALYEKGFTDKQVRDLFARGPEAMQQPARVTAPPSGYQSRPQQAKNSGVGKDSGKSSGQTNSNRSASKRKTTDRTGVTPPAKKSLPSSSQAPSKGSSGQGSSASSSSSGHNSTKVVTPGKTYSNVVKDGTSGAPKSEPPFPHMLTVHTGLEIRAPLSQDSFTLISTKLRKRVLAYGKEQDHIFLKTAFISYQKGFGNIACLDEPTATWYKEEVAKLENFGVHYKAWSVVERGELRPGRLALQGLEDISPEEVLELIHCYTPNLEGRMEVVRVDTKDNLLVLGLDDIMVVSLSKLAKPFVVHLGTDMRKVSVSKVGIPELAVEVDLTKKVNKLAVDPEEKMEEK
jgi:hypothetical protein